MLCGDLLLQPDVCALMCVLLSHWLAVGGAVDAAGAQQVETARRVQAAAALSAVTQAAVVVLHQSLPWPQHASLAKHTHGLTH